MSKVKRKPKAKSENVNAISPSLTQLYYEIDTVKLQLDLFSDEDLFDWCLSDIEKYKHKELDRLYPKLLQKKALTPEERQKLEAFAILTNTELFLVV